MRALARSHIAQIFAFLMAVWAVATFFFTPAQMIEIENSLLAAVGIGITIAYLPGAAVAIRARVPTRGGLLALGIWLAWVAIAMERVYSLIGRALGKDITFFNTYQHTAIIAVAVCGGLCHAAAPEVIDGRFPRRAGIMLGMVSAGGALIVATIVLFVGF